MLLRLLVAQIGLKSGLSRGHPVVFKYNIKMK